MSSTYGENLKLSIFGQSHGPAIGMTLDGIPAIFYKHYPAYVAGNMNVSELARVCGLSRPTVYKYLKMLK